MFGKWIVLEGIFCPSKSFIIKSIRNAYPGCIKIIDQTPELDLNANLVKHLKMKGTIQSLLMENTSVICNSWISSSLAQSGTTPHAEDLNLLNLILQHCRPDLSVALVGSKTNYERNLLKSEHIDLFFLGDHDSDKITRLILNHLLHD